MFQDPPFIAYVRFMTLWRGSVFPTSLRAGLRLNAELRCLRTPPFKIQGNEAMIPFSILDVRWILAMREAFERPHKFLLIDPRLPNLNLLSSYKGDGMIDE